MQCQPKLISFFFFLNNDRKRRGGGVMEMKNEKLKVKNF